MEKRKQASRTPNASRNTTARSMSERQGVRGLPNLAAGRAHYERGDGSQDKITNRKDDAGGVTRNGPETTRRRNLFVRRLSAKVFEKSRQWSTLVEQRMAKDTIIDRVEVSVYRVPTETVESDGTLEWDSTTM